MSIVLSPQESFVIGAFGGALETSLQMPLITWKFFKQSQRPLPPLLPLKTWYRGLGAQAGSLAPITAIQVMFCDFIGTIMLRGEQRKLSDSETLMAGLGSGALSCVVYAPADLITVQQQKLSAGLGDVVKHIVKVNGIAGIWRGAGSCALREGLYVCGYMGVAPLLKQKLVESESWFNGRSFASSLAAASIAGTAASLLSHPIDTSKTMYQADLEGKSFRSAFSAFKTVVRDKGVAALFVGAAPRIFRAIGAAFVIGNVREAYIRSVYTE